MYRILLLLCCALLWLNANEHNRSTPDPIVELQTNQGLIVLKLFASVAPLAVENFTTHVANGYYNGITFHRIIKDFMIQGGDPTGTGRGGASIWDKPFKDEFKPNLIFDRAGLLAMANAGAHTNGSQFFITTAPTPWLNGRHTIFGEVIEGMETLQKLNSVPTSGRTQGDKPLEPQQIIKAVLR